MNNTKPANKGLINDECYRGVCSNKPATYFNHSTCKYYCEECAHLLNRVNYNDAHQMFGHDLCTQSEGTPAEVNNRINS